MYTSRCFQQRRCEEGSECSCHFHYLPVATDNHDILLLKSCLRTKEQGNYHDMTSIRNILIILRRKLPQKYRVSSIHEHQRFLNRYLFSAISSGSMECAIDWQLAVQYLLLAKRDAQLRHARQCPTILTRSNHKKHTYCQWSEPF